MRVIISLFIASALVYCADYTTAVNGNISAIAIDSSGNTYVVGNQKAPTQPPLPYGLQGSTGFVTKLDATGAIVFNKTFGGPCCTYVYAVTVDPTGNVWLAGATSSATFPLFHPLQSTMGDSSYELTSSGFLMKLSADGTILYASYFGGVQGYTVVYGIATDPSGNVYVTGITTAGDFPTTPGLPASPVNPTQPLVGAFITKLDPTGQKVLYSGRMAGATPDCAVAYPCSYPATQGIGVAVDPSGDALVAVGTNTSDMPAGTGVSPGAGAFALKINASGGGIDYLKFLGAGANFINYDNFSPTIAARPIATDAAGDAYITGLTTSPMFPVTPGAYESTYGAGFAMKLGPDGSTIWSTFLGGLSDSIMSGVSLDASDNLWLTGNNGAAGFPTTSPGLVSGSGDFVTELSADGTSLLYSAEFPLYGAGQDIAVDSSGIVHVAGQATVSTITPSSSFAPRVLSILNAAATDSYPRALTPGEIISIYGWGIGPAIPGATVPIGGAFPTSVAGVQVLINGAAVPLLYVSPSQINAEVAAPLTGVETGAAVMQVMNNSVALPSYRVQVATSSFMLFQNESGTAAVNQDGSLNSSNNPAKAGDVVSVWGTGFGNTGQTVDGALATMANNYCNSCQIYVGGNPETVEYLGTSPGLIDGLTQINFRIPAQLNSTHSQEIQINILGASGYVWVSP